MKIIEDEYCKDGRDHDERMYVYGWEVNWQNLEGDPRWWDDANKKVHRTEIYLNGRIVIKNVRSEPHLIIFDSDNSIR